MATKKIIKKNNAKVEENTQVQEADTDPIKEAIKKANEKTKMEQSKKKKSSNIIINNNNDDENNIDDEEIEIEDVDEVDENDTDEEEMEEENDIDEEEEVEEEKPKKKTFLKKNNKNSKKVPPQLRGGATESIKKDSVYKEFIKRTNELLQKKGYGEIDDENILKDIFNIATNVPIEMLQEKLNNTIEEYKSDYKRIPKEKLKCNIQSLYKGGKSLKGAINKPLVRKNPLGENMMYTSIGTKVYVNISTSKTYEVYEDSEKEIIVLDENDNKITFKK